MSLRRIIALSCCYRGTVIQDPRIGTVLVTIGDPQPFARMTEKAAIDYILAALSGGPADNLRRSFNEMHSVKSYRRLIRRAAEAREVPKGFSEIFHTAWSVQGFHWREAVDNDALILRALRAILDPYDGPSQTVFRGEQAARYDAGRLGFNWSSRRAVAEMFGAGLCTQYDGGGVVLSAKAPISAIIAGPGSHSKHLGEDEYVVEPALLIDVTELARHPQR